MCIFQASKYWKATKNFQNIFEYFILRENFLKDEDDKKSEKGK